MASLKEHYIRLRNQIIANPTFQRRTALFPLSRPVARHHAGTLFNMVTGYIASQLVRACSELEVLPMLAERPLTAEEVAQRCDLPLKSAETLLKAAASYDLAESLGDGRYALGETGAALIGNASLKMMIRHHEVLYRDLADPVAMLRAGQGATLAAYWPYGDGDGEASDTYSELMAETQPMIADQILRVYNFGQHSHVLDIGGGAGAFLSAVGDAHPGTKLSLFDLPQVAAIGKDPRILAHGGSFKVDDLPQGADCISLIRILHDHDDDVVRLLLKRAAATLPPRGTLVIAEPMAETRSAKAMGHGYFGFYLLAMGSGRPRTAEEYHMLLKEAGFASSREHNTPMPLICRVISARV